MIGAGQRDHVVAGQNQYRIVSRQRRVDRRPNCGGIQRAPVLRVHPLDQIVCGKTGDDLVSARGDHGARPEFALRQLCAAIPVNRQERSPVMHVEFTAGGRQFHRTIPAILMKVSPKAAQAVERLFGEHWDRLAG